jgi:N-acetylglutamate synthase-like GNAT family acetyltransferase
MKKHEDSYKTGISSITGKVVRIRHATEADMYLIEAELKKNNLSTEGIHHSQFVVATENGELVGFGRLNKIGKDYEISCVTVVEEKRGKGIGKFIIKHLIEYSPTKLVYVITDNVDYFEQLGFTVMKEGAKELFDALDMACKVSGKANTVLMAYEKSGA